jgi:hypothetical protein
VEKFVAVVICGLVALTTAGAPAAARNDDLLRRASRLSGLPVRHVVPERLLAAARYDSALVHASFREYPRSLRSVDASLYTRLGLMPLSGASKLEPELAESRAWYDPLAHKLLLRRVPTPQRTRVVNELVRALVDQNFNLRRIAGLRIRDRDGALAAKGIVDGTAALASGVTASSVRGTPLERFLQSESALAAGKGLARELRYLGGASALASALRTFPQTTEQLLHIDKFLERERAVALPLPTRVGDWRLNAAESFGELDVRSLLSAFGVPNATAVAAGWGGGRVALYVSPAGKTSAVLALRWDTVEDAAEWRDAVVRYVAAAFPGATTHDCPPLDRCWSSSSEVAAGTLGTASIFAGGPASDVLGAAVLGQK